MFLFNKAFLSHCFQNSTHATIAICSPLMYCYHISLSPLNTLLLNRLYACTYPMNHLLCENIWHTCTELLCLLIPIRNFDNFSLNKLIPSNDIKMVTTASREINPGSLYFLFLFIKILGKGSNWGLLLEETSFIHHFPSIFFCQVRGWLPLICLNRLGTGELVPQGILQLSASFLSLTFSGVLDQLFRSPVRIDI